MSKKKAKRKAAPRRPTARKRPISWVPRPRVLGIASEGAGKTDAARATQKPSVSQAEVIANLCGNLIAGLDSLLGRMSGLAGRAGVPQPPNGSAGAEASSRPGIIGSIHDQLDTIGDRLQAAHMIVNAIEEQI